MKKSRIIAVLTALAMIVSSLPAFAASGDVYSSFDKFVVAEDGTVLEKVGGNLVTNPGFEISSNGEIPGLAVNSTYYNRDEALSHSGSYAALAIKSTNTGKTVTEAKANGALAASIPVSDANDSYYLSFWYRNSDSTTPRRPRVTFAFSSDSETIPYEEDSFTDATGAWVGMGNSSNADNGSMKYSTGGWVQYSTIIKGNGDMSKCAYVVLDIYGLKKDVSFIDDVEIYRLTKSDYSDTFAKALDEWSTKKTPSDSYAGTGTISLPTEITSVSGVKVEWLARDERVENNGVSYTWSKENDRINLETGEFVSGKDDTLVVLKAVVYVDGYKDEIYKEYEYPVVIKSMFTPYITWVNSEFDRIGTSVQANVTYNTPATQPGYLPATVEWVCSDPDVLDAEGNFTAPETTEYVDLSAIITCGEDSYTVTRRIKAIGGNIVGDGLVMYYDFESKLGSNSTLYNKSGSETNYNAKAEGITIADGYAYFNGSSAIVLPSNYAVELNGSYSVSMWVKVDTSIAESGGMYRFFDFGGGAYTSQFLRYIPATGQLTFMDRGTASNGSDWAIDTTLSGISGAWKLITFVYDKSNASAEAKVYVDGSLLAKSSSSSLTNSILDIAGTSSTTGFIGRTQWQDSSNPDFKGYMDDVRIYNRAIAESEIATLYTETRPTVTANVTIKYVDTEGNSLADDVTVQSDVDTTYDVPTNYKSVSGYADDNYRYTFKYLASKSTDSVYVTTSGDNTCTLVFQLEKSEKGTNLIANGSFESNTDGWTYDNGGTFGSLQGWDRSSEMAHDGSYSLKKTVTSSNGGTTNYNIGTYIPIDSGRIYHLTWWEYSSAALEAGSHQMMAAVVTSNNTAALGDTSNRLTQYGGWDSWNNGAMGQATRDPAYPQGWSQREFTFDTTGATDANYILIAYANGSATSVNYLDDFVLEDVTSGGSGNTTNPGESDADKIPVIINYVDTEGNTLKDPVEVYTTKGASYTVPSSYKSLPMTSDDNFIYTYTYNASLSSDTVEISVLSDNICTLVFDVETRERTGNLIANGSFEENIDGWTYDNNGTFGALQGWARSSDMAHDGSYSLKKTVTSANGGTTNYNIGTYIPIQSGHIYRLTWWEYSSSALEAGSNQMMAAVVTTNNTAALGDTSNRLTQYGGWDSWNSSAMGQATRDPAYPQGWSQREFTFDTTGATDANYILIAYANGEATSVNYLDEFSLTEILTTSNAITYADGSATITVVEDTEGYLIQAIYDEDGALTNVKISDKLTVMSDMPVKVEVEDGAKLMFVKDLASLEPLCPAIVAGESGNSNTPSAPEVTVDPLVAGNVYKIYDENGKCLNITSSSLTTSADSDSASMKWTLTNAGSGYYAIINKSTNQALDVTNESRDAGTEIGVWDFKTSGSNDNQVFTAEASGNGYLLKMKQSGLYVTVNSNGTITQENRNTEKIQVFRFEVQ
jgi:hypothetical protein